jgi:hypothetical protein
VGVKELALLFLYLIWLFVSSAQTPLPLIHPANSIFGGAERGEDQNQGGDDWAFTIIIWASHIQRLCPSGCITRVVVFTKQRRHVCFSTDG